MEIKVNPISSDIKMLVHGDIRFEYLPVSGFAIFLHSLETGVSAYIKLPLNPKTLELAPTTDWHSDGVNKIPTVSCKFDNGFVVVLESYDDYFVFCHFFGVQDDDLIFEHFKHFNANALEG